MAGEAAKEKKGLDKLSSRGEEAVMRSGKTDTKHLQAVIAKTYDAEKKEAEEREAAEKKLKEIAVRREDIEFLFKNFDLTIPLADRALRMNGGDLTKTLQFLMTPVVTGVEAPAAKA